MRTAQEICDDINGEQTSITNAELQQLVDNRDHWMGRALRAEATRRKYCEEVMKLRLTSSGAKK